MHPSEGWKVVSLEAEGKMAGNPTQQLLNFEWKDVVNPWVLKG